MCHRLPTLLAVLILGGCGGSLVDYRSPESGTRYFPPPAVFRTATLELGARVPPSLRTPEVRLAFASTRRPGGASFIDEPDGALHLGQVTMRIGPAGTTWDDLVDWARLDEQQVPPVRVELAALDRFGCSGSGSADGSPDARFLAGLEPMYAHGGRRVLLFVHGADTSFAEAAATIASLHHHQGRVGAAVLFSWPSGNDARLRQGGGASAVESSDALARLIASLSGPGKTERIDCLADSTGTGLLIGALRRLEDTIGRDGMARLRIGSVVLASPGKALADSTSQDASLVAATASRAVVYSFGAERRQSPTVQHERIEIVDIASLPGPGDTDGFTRHGAWYANPLVVTDALLTLLSGLPAAQRGLVRDDDAPVWTLPADYALRAATVIAPLVGGKPE